MSIHSRESRVDAKVASGILARSVLEYLGDKNREEESGPLTNVIRLLEMYRHQAFSSPTSQGILQRRPLTKAPSITEPRGQSMESVQQALAAAHRSVFGAQSRDAVVDLLEEVVGSVMDANEAGVKVSDQDVGRTKSFFDAFLKALDMT